MTDLERARDELRKARTLLARWQGIHQANAAVAKVGGTYPDPTDCEVMLNDQTEAFLADWQAGQVSGK